MHQRASMSSVDYARSGHYPNLSSRHACCELWCLLVSTGQLSLPRLGAEPRCSWSCSLLAGMMRVPDRFCHLYKIIITYAYASSPPPIGHLLMTRMYQVDYLVSMSGRSYRKGNGSMTTDSIDHLDLQFCGLHDCRFDQCLAHRPIRVRNRESIPSFFPCRS